MSERSTIGGSLSATAAASPSADIGISSETAKFPESTRPLTVESMDTRSPDRKSTRLNSSHLGISYAVFCLKKNTTVRIRSDEHTSEPASPSHSVFRRQL